MTLALGAMVYGVGLVMLIQLMPAKSLVKLVVQLVSVKFPVLLNVNVLLVDSDVVSVAVSLHVCALSHSCPVLFDASIFPAGGLMPRRTGIFVVLLSMSLNNVMFPVYSPSAIVLLA